MLRPAGALGFLFLLTSEVYAAPAIAELVSLAYKPCGGMICLPVTLTDGRSHVLLLDTGNVNSWLLADTARAMGLKLEAIEQDGKTLPGLYRLGVQQVSLQGQALSGRFLALSREQTGELPAEVEGALAYPLFKDKVLQIDYAHLLVRVFKPQPADRAVPGSELKLISFGKQGPPIVVEAAVESVSFGPYVLSRQPAPVYFPGTTGSPVHQPDGLFEAPVGNALFVRSVVTLDFHSMKISVQPG